MSQKMEKTGDKYQKILEILLIFVYNIVKLFLFRTMIRGGTTWELSVI